MSTKSDTLVGQALLRREDDRLLRGASHYVDDLPTPQDTLHLSFVLSTQPHANILGLDKSAALKIPGVVDVLDGDELAKLVKPLYVHANTDGYRAPARDVIARRKARFVGEYVAVCIAETPYLALDAADAVYVDYEALPSVSDALVAMESGSPLVHEELGDNILFQASARTDGFDDVFQNAAHVIEEEFRLGRVAAVSMEPRGCLVIPERGGESIVFYTSTQIPHLVRTALAEFTGFSESAIRVVTPEVGGGFGMKSHVYPDEIIAAALAIKYRRPVKWIQDRREDLLTNTHARDHRLTLSAAFDETGRILALKNQVVVNSGAYSSYPYSCNQEPLSAARMALGPYRIPYYSYETKGIATHTCPTGAYRGTGSVSAFFAIEGIMDRIARRLGVDPADIRSRNLVRDSDFPYTNAFGMRYDTGSYEKSLAVAQDIFGYDEYRRNQRTNRLSDGKYRGVGIASFIELSGVGSSGWGQRGVHAIPGYDSVTLRVEPSGHITTLTSQAAAGQGHYTTFAQLTADHLGARFEDVTVMEGDTSIAPYGTNTMASRSALVSGAATILAAEKLSAKLRRIAGHLLETRSNDIELHDGYAFIPSEPQRRVSFKEIAKAAYSVGRNLPEGEEYGLEASATYDPPIATVANAVHIASVSIGADDGQVEVERYVIVSDCGRIINPMIVDGQILGAVVQGIGEALMEEIVYDASGQLQNGSLLDYLLPTAMDVPNITIHHIETPGIDTVGGFKGVGEGGLMGAVPAIANAVNDALAGFGANINTVPIRPDALLDHIRAHTSHSD